MPQRVAANQRCDNRPTGECIYECDSLLPAATLVLSEWTKTKATAQIMSHFKTKYDGISKTMS